MQNLRDEELLHYNFGLMKWAWDMDSVRSKLVTKNVASVLTSKLNRLDKPARTILRVASCIGATFEMSTIAIVVGALPPDETEIDVAKSERGTASEVSRLVDELERQGIIEKGKDSTAQCHFSHDQIQYAAFELISPEKRDAFRGDIGRILMNEMDHEALEDNLFVIVSLKNFGAAYCSTEERLELARLNLRAGMKASNNATFDTAAVFYRKGRHLLGQDAWRQDGNTMLQLCSKEAKACFISGDHHSMTMLIEEVLSRESLSIEDKFSVYETKIRAANASARFEEAINTAIDVRTKLGLPSPKNQPASKLTVIKEYLKTDRLLASRTAEDIANLPTLEDERLILGQRMTELLSTFSCHALKVALETVRPCTFLNRFFSFFSLQFRLHIKPSLRSFLFWCSVWSGPRSNMV